MTGVRAAALVAAIAAVALAAPARAGEADRPPPPPITIVVAFPPGGLADNTARPLAAALARILRRDVVVENKVGESGALGYASVAGSKPDGQTLVLALTSVAVLPEVDLLNGRAPRYTRDQLVGIARVNADPSLLTVRAETPWRNVEEFVADAKARPEEITFTSSGPHSTPHLPMAMLEMAAGVRLRHVPSTGGGPMMKALLAGEADAVMAPVSLTAEHVRAGRLRYLAHTGTGTVAAFPTVPSLRSRGISVEFIAWSALAAPRGTPPATMRVLCDAVREAVSAPEVVAAHAKLETPIAYLDGDELERFLAQDAARLAAAVKQLGKG